MAGVLTSTSYPHRTSPVLRGKWVLNNLLGSPPHPPPPNIPPLDKTGSSEEGLTLRARLLAHRADPACAGCHQAMDAIGLGLEIFDATGRLRDSEDGHPIEIAGTLPGQVPLENMASLRNWLRAHQDDFVRNLVLRMFGYALGRGLTPADYPDVELTVERLERSDYHALELFLGIAESRAFQSCGPRDPLLP